MNAAGLKPKLNSLKAHINKLQIAIFTIQETHSGIKGRFEGEFEDHVIFEAIRQNKKKGGTLIGAHKSLNPVLIKEYSEEFELLVVEVKVNKQEIRIISGYGPQETWPEPQRSPFWIAFETEIEKANIAGKEIITAMDANTKLGEKWISQDINTKKACDNALLLEPIILRHDLIVGNGHVLCHGVVTRKRVLTNRTEESTIDLVLMSRKMSIFIKSMIVDEEQNFALFRITETKNGVVVKKTDHNAIITELEIPWQNGIKKERIQMLNFKNKECQKKFYKETSQGTYLSSALDGNECLNTKTKNFIKRFNKVCKKTFKVIRIKHKKEKELDDLFHKWNKLKNKTNNEDITECKKVEEILATKYAEEYFGRIKQATETIDSSEGGFNSGKLWKLKRDLFPQDRDPPTSMIDKEGILQTDPVKILEATTDAYSHRLRSRPIKEGLESVKDAKEKLCNERLTKAKNNKTPDWTMNELEKVLEHLKKDISRDPNGYINELFKPEVAGIDLKKAILNLMNSIKDQQIIPEELQMCNISSIWKRKASRHEFDSYRGIFRVTVLRNILELLIYKDEYPNLDKKLSDCNVGGRRGRNVRDNIFVLNAILNSISKGTKEAHDIQVYDNEQCFDSLWLQECINALYEAEFTNDKLSLLFLLNSHAQVAIKNSSGITERRSMFNIVMQGTVWGTMFCVAIMNKLIKLVHENPDLLFFYKGKVAVPPLEMVDDVLAIQKCGPTSEAINTTINSFMETEKLTLSHSKTHVIHVGKNRDKCSNLKVHDKNMDNSDKEKYLGDKIDTSGKPRATILDRKAKGYGIVGQIVAITEEAPLGMWRMRSAMLLRDAMLVNSMLFNSEAWQGIVRDDIEQLSRVDVALFRKLISSHSKTPSEALFLETGQIPISFIWSSRRLLYLQTLLKRDVTEVTRQIYETQKIDCTKGDFYQLVTKDAKSMEIEINEKEIAQMSKSTYKKFIKTKVKTAAFKHLQSLQEGHSKVKNIKYHKLQMQPYMMHPCMNSDDIALLFALRTRCVRGIRNDFREMFSTIRCELCDKHDDTLPNLLMCEQLTHVPRNGSIYLDVFSQSVQNQKESMLQYRGLLKAREGILKKREEANLTQDSGPLLGSDMDPLQDTIC